MIKSPHTQDDEEFNEFMKSEGIKNRFFIGVAIAYAMLAVGLLINYFIHQ